MFMLETVYVNDININYLYNLDMQEIKDITKLYVHKKSEYFLLYEEDPEIKELDDILLYEIINDYFENIDIIEYREIVINVFAYVEKHIFTKNKKIKYHDVILHIMINKNNTFTKNHNADKNGYIKLFTIYFRDDYNISMYVNPLYLVDKIDITMSPSKYSLVPENQENQDDMKVIENSENECIICMESIITNVKNPIVQTPCNHFFHLNCLKYSHNFSCPMCRRDVKDFLQTQGISKEELDQRLTLQKNDVELDEYNEIIDVIDQEIGTDLIHDFDFIRMSMETLKLSNGYMKSYMDIIFDTNMTASNLFAEINYIQEKITGERGFFIYAYKTPIQFVCQMLIENSKNRTSIVRWKSISETNKIKPNIIQQIKNKLNEINNTKNEYVVVAIIGKTVDIRCINKSDHQKIGNLENRDILLTLLKSKRYRTAPEEQKKPTFKSSRLPTINDCELQWASQTLKSLLFTNEKKLEKYEKIVATQQNKNKRIMSKYNDILKLT